MTKPYYAGATVTKRRFVKPGSADNAAILAAANTDAIFGVSGPSIDATINLPFDVVMAGIAEIELGGAVTRGDYLTSDANGMGVELSDTILDAAGANSGGVALQSGVSGDIIKMLVYPQKVAKNDTVSASVAEIDVLDGAPMGATITVGSEAANVINVGIQLEDADGADIAVRGSVFAYLSDDANGDSIVATAPDGGAAIGTDGLAIPVVANKAFELTSESDGDIDIDITESGAKTCYLILRMPNGKLVASGAITFA